MNAYAFCTRCLNNMATIEHDGQRGFCVQCHTPFVFHQCQGIDYGLQGIPIQTWVPILKPFITHVCSACGGLITIGEQLEKSPDPQVSSFGFELVKLGIVIGGAILLSNLFREHRR